MRLIALTSLLLIQASLSYSRSEDTLRVFFQFNSAVLSSRQQSMIDSAIYHSRLHAGQELLIVGYADYVGRDAANLALSRRRALAVKDYLTKYHSLGSNVLVCSGNGERRDRSLDGQKGKAADRIVDIVVRDRKTTETVNKKLPPAILALEADTLHAQDKKYKVYFKEWPEVYDEFFPEYLEWAIAHNKAREAGLDPCHHDHSSKGVILMNEVKALDKSQILRNLGRGHKSGYSGYSTSLLNLALIYGLAGNQDSMFYCLNTALDSCMRGRDCDDIWDPNILGFYQFRRYTELPRWQSFEARILARYREHTAVNNPTLSLKLIKAGGADQSIRFSTTADNEGLKQLEWERISKTNKLLIREIVLKHGFPRESDVGRNGSEAAFLLVQHLENDTTFQQVVLDQMIRLAAIGEIRREKVALLTDRVMVNTIGKQLYGTQFRYLTDDSKNTKTELFPIVEPNQVNQRRREMGLPPLEEL